MDASASRWGPASTPPMGWMSWNAFGRDLTEGAVVATADAMVTLGLRDAGYQYVCLDDYWHGTRDADGRLRPHPTRFPSGIPALADEIHRRGLKLGIYTCAGSRTCGGEVGSEGHEALDAATFAEWGVDYVKDDYCHAPSEREAAIERYARMGEGLAASGREIVFALCEWGQRSPWEWAASVRAHLWRTTGDIRDRWSGEGGILTNAELTEPLAAIAGPNGWNDADMLVAGLRGRSRQEAAGTAGCTNAEYRSQLSLWAMMAAPLFISCDLRLVDEETVAMLTALAVLAIDQDPLGRPGRRVARTADLDLWQRPLDGGATAVAILNRGERSVSVRLKWTGEAPPGAVADAWTGHQLPTAAVELELEPHGTALLRIEDLAGNGGQVARLEAKADSF